MVIGIPSFNNAEQIERAQLNNMEVNNTKISKADKEAPISFSNPSNALPIDSVLTLTNSSVTTGNQTRPLPKTDTSVDSPKVRLIFREDAKIGLNDKLAQQFDEDDASGESVEVDLDLSKLAPAKRRILLDLEKNGDGKLMVPEGVDSLFNLRQLTRQGAVVDIDTGDRAEEWERDDLNDAKADLDKEWTDQNFKQSVTALNRQKKVANLNPAAILPSTVTPIPLEASQGTIQQPQILGSPLSSVTANTIIGAPTLTEAQMTKLSNISTASLNNLPNNSILGAPTLTEAQMTKLSNISNASLNSVPNNAVLGAPTLSVEQMTNLSNISKTALNNSRGVFGGGNQFLPSPQVSTNFSNVQTQNLNIPNFQAVNSPLFSALPLSTGPNQANVFQVQNLLRQATANQLTTPQVGTTPNATQSTTIDLIRQAMLRSQQNPTQFGLPMTSSNQNSSFSSNVQNNPLLFNPALQQPNPQQISRIDRALSQAEALFPLGVSLGAQIPQEAELLGLE